MDTKTRSGSTTNYATYPTKIDMESSGRMVGQHVWVTTRVTDITGNVKSIKDRYKEYWANKLEYSWGLGSYPTPDYSAGNYEVTKTGTIKIRFTTYGNSGAVSNLSYATLSNGDNDPCVTVDGNNFIIDGAKLTEDNHNVNVYAKYGGSGYIQVGRFTISHVGE